MTWTLFSAHGRECDVDKPLIMGILNATPDSFSDGGRIDEPGHVTAMLAAAPDIIDIGGESTRPGHAPVAADEEIARVVPVIEQVRRAAPDAWISIDTQKASVARAALDAGADLVNDVSGLGDPAMARLVRDRGCSIILMRNADCHGDIVHACRDQLRALLVRAQTAGIAAPQIILDPGLGFGARPGADVADNLALLDATADVGLGHPVLIGHSRKRFVVAHAGLASPAEADAATAELSARAVAAGAAMLRVHAVEQTRRALQ